MAIPAGMMIAVIVGTGSVNRDRPEGWLAFFSNICWLVWVGLALLLVVMGLAAFGANPWAGWIYVLVILGLLNSV